MRIQYRMVIILRALGPTNGFRASSRIGRRQQRDNGRMPVADGVTEGDSRFSSTYCPAAIKLACRAQRPP